jgi:hypothetical protein
MASNQMKFQSPLICLTSTATIIEWKGYQIPLIMHLKNASFPKFLVDMWVNPRPLINTWHITVNVRPADTFSTGRVKED